MPIETPLNRSPYYDDHDPLKNYYRELFQPGVSVQVRELNQLQTLFQQQIERMGNNLFTRGTIIDGCNFSFFPSYPYIKILDIEQDGTPSSPSRYLNFVLTNETSGLKSYAVKYEDGFEATDPDLKTLYLKYLNSGTDSNTFAYSAGDVLKVTNFADGVFKIAVNNGGLGFSNSDELIITSALVVNVSTGSFSNGEYITNDLGANLQIIEIDNTTLANTNQVILSLRPRNTDLANATVNTAIWTISNNDAIRNVSNTVAATVEALVGSGLTGEVITNGVGKITDILITDSGEGFSKAPTATVKSANNSSGLSVLSLTAQNYLAKLTVASTANAVGNGYAFGVSEGIIYQKGYFVRVDSQTVVVEKYHQSPNAVVVGFQTVETIVDANIDPTLNDNAFTEENENAPGADRLKLTPLLAVMAKTDSDANSEFFPIVEWSEGNPYKQKQFTSYNKIGDAVAKSVSDIAGNFVKDPFLVATRSPLSANTEAEYSSLVIDPGKAYIEGREVTTSRNFVLDIRNGTDSSVSNVQITSLGYGNYLDLKYLVGVFQFNTGDSVKLYDTAKNFTDYSGANTTPAGTQIGTANIRSLVRHPTNPEMWRLYLFNVNMNAGRNFTSVRSIYYDGTNKGIADVSVSSSNTVALQRPADSTLLFYSGAPSMKNSSNNVYTYRTLDQTTATSNNGTLTKDISASVNEFFPYSGSLTSLQLKDLMVLPLANLQCNVSLTGTIAVTASSVNVTGTSTTFLTDLVVGDYLTLFSNSTASDIRRIASISNNTFLQLSNTASFTNATAVAFRVFPKYIPVPFGFRSGLSANVDANSNILTLDFGMRFGHTGTVNTSIGVNIQRRNVTQVTKTANRNKFVKIQISNNAGGVNGPWCLGVPDAFRLRNVYVDDSAVDESSANYKSEFYIDHNQNPDFLGLSYLYLKPRSPLSLTSSNYILAEFDYFTSSEAGFWDAISYVSANATQRFEVDSLPLSNLTSSISSWEIPIVVSTTAGAIDLMSQYDFRPSVANTALPTSTANSAPVNPAETISFGNTASVANEKKFPLPDSNFQSVLERWEGRVDSVLVNKEGQIRSVEGKPLSPERLTTIVMPPAPQGNMKISDVIVPAYPTLPQVKSVRLLEILNTGVANEIWLKQRLGNRTISKPKTRNAEAINQPRSYTMEDIAKIDNRLRNVEYYVAMSLMESDLVSRAVPSSIDPTLDRFKYGFFVNDFHSYLNLDNKNPQFAAILEDDDLVPSKMVWSLPFEDITGPGEYIDFLASNQENATVAPGAPPPSCLPTSNVGFVNFLLQQDSRAAFEGIHKTGASNSAIATLYFCHFGSNRMGGSNTIFGGRGGIAIYQLTSNNALPTNSSVPVATQNNAVSLTNTDLTFLTSNTTQNWFSSIPEIKRTTPFTGNSTNFTGAFKISWNYNPVNGRNILIFFNQDRRNDQVNWKSVFVCPVDRTAVGCEVDGTVDNLTPPPTIVTIVGCSNGPRSAAMDLDDLEGDDVSFYDTMFGNPTPVRTNITLSDFDISSFMAGD